MKKLSLLIALILCVTIGGVYATWTYTETTNVADDTVNMSLNLTKATTDGSYGTYEITTSSDFAMVIDPKEGTEHVTALYITGDITITFTPAQYAPTDVKKNAVPSTFQFALSSGTTTSGYTAWDFEGQSMIALAHNDAEEIEWSEPDENGVFSYVISAADLANHIRLTEITLDTLTKYNRYGGALGQISITVSDGVTA